MPLSSIRCQLPKLEASEINLDIYITLKITSLHSPEQDHNWADLENIRMTPLLNIAMPQKASWSTLERMIFQNAAEPQLNRRLENLEWLKAITSKNPIGNPNFRRPPSKDSMRQSIMWLEPALNLLLRVQLDQLYLTLQARRPCPWLALNLEKRWAMISCNNTTSKRTLL